MMQVQIEKTDIKNLPKEDLVFEFERIVAIEKLVKEYKQKLRQEIISRYGVNAVHQVGDKKLIIEERKRKSLDIRAVKSFLNELGKLDDFMVEKDVIYVMVK